MKKFKQLITLSISLLLFFLNTNFAYGKINEYQIFPSSIGSNRFYFLPLDLRPSDKPYLFWECRSSQINNLNLYYEINNSSSNGRTVALGNKSDLGGCSGETPFRYDFTFSFDKNFINQLILDKGCLGYCDEYQGTFGLIEFPARFGLPNVLVINYKATFSELNPLPVGFTYSNQIKSSNFKTGEISAIKVEHDVTNGSAAIQIKFRVIPKNKTFSISYGSGFNVVKGGEDVVCSGGIGAKFENFPNLNVAEESDLKPNSATFSNNTLNIEFLDNNLKAETFRKDNFKNFPTCFGITYWVSKSKYSSGNNCNGMINNGFINLNCKPYSGWSTWRVVGNTYQLTFPKYEPFTKS